MAGPEEKLTVSLAKVLDWAESQDYAGHSKFDTFNSPFLKTLSLDNRWIRLAMTTAWTRMPFNLRPILRVSRSRNPKGIGLFALAYLRRFAVTGDPADLQKAEDLLAWLDQNAAPGFAGKCWGYDHDWQSLHFYAPKYSPNIVVTGNVTYAFLEAYEATGKQQYLEIARSSLDFMLHDLATPFENETMRSIGYIPGSHWSVLNINGLAAALMAWAGKHTGEPELRKTAAKLIAFLVDKQTGYGAWHYAWPSDSSNVKHDNYHTGNILDWVLDYGLHTGDDRYLGNYKTGLQFYRENLFLPDGAPKWMSTRPHPFDVHGAAQAVVTFTKAGQSVAAEYLEDAGRTAMWAVNNMQAAAGYFYYQKGRWMTKKYTLMRWCNAWMAYALASYLQGVKEADGKALAAG